ncbi:alanine racemase domain protein [Alkaliphilus metalliredigens QYMF]|uniref:Pyridoxal phosphate homeostasis protein n=1 Tax=Alkaliphilus metalliredigens (strain QYMF) TaxID=293826 RepID=A6TRY6_ALKMQ|nr:YggS family pyridoxal phosphate-dependent enzyme [Alkaliphilus metalliredigens]ABR48954.1 alanine racemase domain protein [Alkaliphilus metalliredigens QYMF]
MSIEARLNTTLDRIKEAAVRGEQKHEEVRLIAVTKTVDIDVMQQLIDLGVRDMGENKVQELTRKYEALGNKVKWHMIGHLQRNKVKYIIDKVDFIHSLDSYALALEIEKQAGKINRVIECLIQVNISGEESKYGLTPKATEGLLEKIKDLSHVQIVGLMTMAPYVDNPEETRMYFRDLKILSSTLEKKYGPTATMKYLSMGMTNDFQIAIEEGSNLVRVGTAILGERNYGK